MNRASRLNSARSWLLKYEGQRIVRGYAKWYGVDLECAITELAMLGVRLDPEYVQRVRQTLENRARERTRAQAKAAQAKTSDWPEGYGEDWDDNHAYIAGFTSGGAAYGITWEQQEELEKRAIRQPGDEEFDYGTTFDDESDDDPVPF